MLHCALCFVCFLFDARQIAHSGFTSACLSQLPAVSGNDGHDSSEFELFWLLCKTKTAKLKDAKTVHEVEGNNRCAS